MEPAFSGRHPGTVPGRDLLEQKRKGGPIATTRKPAPTNVFNLMDALKQSIQSSGKPAPATKSTKGCLPGPISLACLPTPASVVPAGAGCLHEIKHDG